MSSELRNRINTELKEGMHAKNEIKTATIRLIIAAIKDRDISARTKGDGCGITDDEILSLFQTMMKQRTESMKMYHDGGRDELAAREANEIKIIESFLPAQFSDEEIGDAVQQAMDETGATGVKDMGRVMAFLKDNYAGQMDFGKASQIVKSRLI